MVWALVDVGWLEAAGFMLGVGAWVQLSVGGMGLKGQVGVDGGGALEWGCMDKNLCLQGVVV